jgi:hypothetical protein
MPQQAMATVGGTTHRLKWLDRNSGWRMGCSCGWVDSQLRLSQRSAINVGNAHVKGARRAGRTPQQKRQDDIRTKIVLVIVVLAIVVAIGVHFFDVATRNAYNDGYQWGEANTIHTTAPSCSQSEMASSGDVSDSNFIFTKPQGDDKPNDNFSQWHHGCEVAAKNDIAEYNSS